MPMLLLLLTIDTHNANTCHVSCFRANRHEKFQAKRQQTVLRPGASGYSTDELNRSPRKLSPAHSNSMNGNSGEGDILRQFSHRGIPTAACRAELHSSSSDCI